MIKYTIMSLLLCSRYNTYIHNFSSNRYFTSVKINIQMKKEKEFNKLNILYNPKTVNQEKYMNILNKKEDYIALVVGPAGTGKTLLACSRAISNLKDNTIDKIVITRPAVSVEEEIGFLPGNMVKKMDPWTRPIFDIFEEYYSKIQISNMISNGQIEISPLGFMRGRTFKNAFIIADEMQNSSPNQMFMLLTRIGNNSRMVITGDLEQSDKFDNNGLKDLLKKCDTYEKLKNIYVIKLNKDDIQRSELVQEVINLYNCNTSNSSNVLNKEIELIKPVIKSIVSQNNTKNNITYNNIFNRGTGDASIFPLYYS